MTPLGWCVVLGVVCGALRSNLKLSFLSAVSVNPRWANAIKQSCIVFSQKEQVGGETITNEDDPWYKLDALLGIDTYRRVLDLVRELDEFSDSLGLEVSELQMSPRFRMEPTEFVDDEFQEKQRTYDVRLEDGQVALEPWQISSAATANEPSTAKTESVLDEGKKSFYGPKRVTVAG